MFVKSIAWKIARTQLLKQKLEQLLEQPFEQPNNQSTYSYIEPLLKQMICLI